MVISSGNTIKVFLAIRNTLFCNGKTEPPYGRELRAIRGSGVYTYQPSARGGAFAWRRARFTVDP